MKKNAYLFLSLLCLAALIIINISFSPVKRAGESKAEKILTNIEAMTENPQRLQPLAAIGLLYIFLFTAGTINIALFAIRKRRGLTILELNEENKPLPLPAKKAWRSLFYILFFILTVTVVRIKAIGFLEKIGSLNFSLIANFAIEAAIIAILAHAIPYSFLFPGIKKEHIGAGFKIFTAMFPMLLAAAILGKFIIKFTGARQALNPAIEILFALKSAPAAVFLAFQVIVLGPWAEEMFFRGFIYKLLRKKVNFFAGASIVSIAFALLHKTPQDILPLFTISFCLCFVYEKTQNLTIPIVFHSLFNTLNFTAIFVIKNIL